jgi:YHS domain-containing protein
MIVDFAAKEEKTSLFLHYKGKKHYFCIAIFSG